MSNFSFPQEIVLNFNSLDFADEIRTQCILMEFDFAPDEEAGAPESLGMELRMRYILK